MLPPRILVAGSAGQLGSHLCRLLGPVAIGLDLPQLDVTCRDSVLSALRACRPNVVVNAAAYTLVDRAETEPEACRAVNLRGVANLLAACRDCGASLVQVSTDYVFDGQSTQPYSETDAAGPLNVYGQSKWEAEQLVTQDSSHLVVRTAGLFGRGGRTAAGNFVDTMLRLAHGGEKIRVVHDQVTSFTFAGDLAAAILSLLSVHATGLYHVANAGHATWYQFAREVFCLAGLQPSLDPIPMAQYPCRAKRPAWSVLSTAKYDSVSGRYPMPTRQRALAAYLALRGVPFPCQKET